MQLAVLAPGVVAFLLLAICGGCNPNRISSEQPGDECSCREVFNRFYARCVEGDYEGALACWTPESKPVLEKMFPNRGGYPGYFKLVGSWKNPRVKALMYGKNRSIEILVIETDDGPNTYMHIKRIDGCCYLHEPDPIVEARRNQE